MTLKLLFTEALEEKLRRRAGEDSSREAPWMAGFGALSDLAGGNRRVLGVIEEEFETLYPMAPHDPRHQCLVRLGGRARDRWGSLLAAALVAAFLWTAFGAASPVHADSRTVEQFLGQYLNGCVRQSRARGHDRLQGHAWCVCAVAQLRMEGSEAALEELARHVARGESIDRLEIFRRATRNRGRCDALGTHDAGPPDRLERSRNFGPFTIALPPGFLLLDRNTAPARASYGFHRLHGDLRSAATLQVVIRRASEDGRSGDDDADEFRLRGLLDELARSRSNFRVVETGEVAAGNLRFRHARWQAAEAGDPTIGEVYAGGSGDTVVLIRLQDRERFASRTMPAMRAALATLRLR